MFHWSVWVLLAFIGLVHFWAQIKLYSIDATLKDIRAHLEEIRRKAKG
jgi:hypothetical protein